MNFQTYKKSLIYSFSKIDHFTKVASFDLDNTIITTKSGKKFPIDKNDWKFFNQYVKEVLYDYYNQCYKIVIFTNQLGIKKGKIKKEDFLDKIANIQKELNIEFDILISIADDYYRKPMTGMWDFFLEHYQKEQKGQTINYKKSFYCGDAAGRKGDFDMTDIQFAHNIGLPFEIPENIFKPESKSKIKYETKADDYYGLDLKKLIKTRTSIDIKPHKKQEMIIMVGRQGSGKTEFSKELSKKLKDYVHINQDICKTKAKCYKMTEDSLKQGKNVIIDSTNPDKKTRAEYIKIGKKYNTHIRVFIMDIPELLAKHLNNYRVQVSKGEVDRIPEVAYRIFNKKYEEPSKDEGIDEIEKVPFNFRIMGDKEKDKEKMFLYHYRL